MPALRKNPTETEACRAYATGEKRMKIHSRTTEDISITDLKPAIRNARTHSDAQIGLIAKSIQTFGFVNTVRGTGILMGGDQDRPGHQASEGIIFC